MNLTFRISILSVAVMMLAAPCSFAQGFKIDFRCKAPTDTYSQTTWNVDPHRCVNVQRSSRASSTPYPSGTMPKNYAGQPSAPWGTVPNSPVSLNSGYPGQTQPLSDYSDWPGPRRLIVSEWGSRIERVPIEHFPSYIPARTPYRMPQPTWHEGLNNEEVRAKTIWTGANREDRKMQSEIVEKQLRDGPESQETIQLLWSRAEYFMAAQKPALAEPLLKELIVTLESHALTPERRKMLGMARTKLYKLQSIKARIENPSYGKTIAPRFPRGF